jgi:homoserine dehydrogenase
MATLSQVRAARRADASRCRVALVGLGTVGKSVAQILQGQRDESPLQLTHICNRNVARKQASWVGPDVAWSDDIREVLATDADVVVELMGGLEPAFELLRCALQSGKAAVTANKQLIAEFGLELQQLADDRGLYLGFGACVAGGVPVLSALSDGLAGDQLTSLRGILNGTCNYILSRIEHAGCSFDDALAEAQQAGFAEADPGDDVDGLDAGAKLAILARVGLHVQTSLKQVTCRSIRDVKAIDFQYAAQLGYTIRQISTAVLSNDMIHMAVEPTLVPKNSGFAKVSGSQNLVVSSGQFGGETTFGGCGAGGGPTAVAVVSDLLQAAHRRSYPSRRPARTAVISRKATTDVETSHYLRFVVRDRPGIIATLAGVLSRHDINLDAVLQQPGYSKAELPFVITLEPCATSRLQPALAEICEFDFLVESPVRMPIVT